MLLLEGLNKTNLDWPAPHEKHPRIVPGELATHSMAIPVQGLFIGRVRMTLEVGWSPNRAIFFSYCTERH